MKAAVMVVVLLTAAACTGSKSAASTTAAPSPGAATSTSPATTTTRAAANPPVALPAKVGDWARLDTALTAQVIQALTSTETGADVRASGVAFYGADEADPALLLVGLRIDPARAGDGQARVDKLLAGLGAAPGSTVDPSTRTDIPQNGITFTCGTAQFSGRDTAYCTWSKDDLTAIAFSIPPTGPSDPAALVTLAAEAAGTVR